MFYVAKRFPDLQVQRVRFVAAPDTQSYGSYCIASKG
jgi:hypothetical protein